MARPLTPDQLLEAAKMFGAPVREYAGWRERGVWRQSRGFDPHWITIHHTAGEAGGSVERYIRDVLVGDPAVPDKCTVAIDRDGVIWMVTAGRANHHLMYSQRGYDAAVSETWPIGGPSVNMRGSQQNGNAYSYGVECIAAGTPNDAQLRSATRWAAGMCRVLGWSAGSVLGHGELADDRDFSDPGWRMGDFRAEVARLLGAQSPSAPAAAPAVPPTLAMPVAGRIGQRYMELGGPGGPLGQPTGPEVPTPEGAWVPFEHGVILWTPATDAHENRGAIRERYADYGYERGILGYPTTDEIATRSGGRFQHFQHGSIYWHPDTGAHAIYGSIFDKWAALGYENGPLGYPVSDEFDGAKPGGRVQRFQGGVVYWTPALGAWPVWGMMLEQYGRDGYEAGRWGYPGGGENRVGDEFFQGFEGGIMEVGSPRQAQVASAPASKYVRPVRDPDRFPISAAYGIPGNLWQAGHHTGVDIAAPIGTPVYATIGGDVRTNSRSWGAAYGNLLIINDNEDGSDWGYCHLSRHAVKDGQRVETGQLIGYVGDTGHVTGPHLHLERRPRQGGYGSDRNPNLW